eukprot:10493046-Alexandrium_andersonii.AAC.1
MARTQFYGLNVALTALRRCHLAIDKRAALPAAHRATTAAPGEEAAATKYELHGAMAARGDHTHTHTRLPQLAAWRD